MSNRFLTPDNASVNISNGSTAIFGASIGAQNLNSGMPVKTNSLGNLVSSKLDISDVNDLQASLDSGLRNPFPSTLIVADLKTDNVVSVDSAITTLQNTVITNPSAVSIEAQGFIKTGGASIEYLMANGSTLTASANSGNSNFYLYDSGTSESTTPPEGFITYNDATQSNASMIYISHKTRDNFDIEVFFYQITTLSQVYVQDQLLSSKYIQFNVIGVPEITPEAQIAIPVSLNSSGASDFANGRNVFISFFTNGLEVDTRISALETKTQNITGLAGITTYSGNIDLSNNDIINFNSITPASGKTLNIGNNNVNYNTSLNAVVGSTNTINDNEQWIFGTHNGISSNISVAVGSYNNVNSFCGNAIGRTNILNAGHCNAMGFNNTCSASYSVAIGNDIINSTPNSVCLGDSEISTIFPNSLVCDLGKTATPYKDVYISGSVKTDPANSAPIIYGNGNTIAGGNNNIYIGKNNIQSTKSNNNIVGYGNGVYGSNTNIFGTSNITGTNIDNTLIFGVGCTATANYAACFGNNCNNTIANTTLIGDPNITSIYPNSAICDLGNATTPFKNIYYSGQLINPTNPILNITNTATLFYNSITLATSNSSFIPSSCLTNVGGAISQVSQDNTTSKGKLFKTLFQPSSTAGFQDAGLIGNTAFLLNSQRLYIGMGFNIKISFGVADGGNPVVNSTAGMFVGLSSSNAIAWSAGLLPTTLINCIGIGHDPLGSNINFIFRGATTGQTIATQFNTSTPDNRWFHLSLTNQFNSNNIVVSLTEAISGITETNTFICGAGSSSLATTAQLYPCIQRMMGAGGGVPQSAQVHFGQLTYNQLI